MNKYHECQLEWEQLRNGEPVILRSAISEIKRPGAALKNVAITKMVDISSISALFGNDLLVFEPWISVLLDLGETITFYGAYALAFPVEDDRYDLPRICVRSCSWNMREDYSRFEQASDKQAYIWSSAQVKIDLSFGLSSTYVPIAALASDLSKLIEKGLCRRTISRSDMPWHKVSVDINSDFFHWKYAYSPLASIVDGLESWLKEWQETLMNLRMEMDSVQAANCKISYRPSMIDRMSIC